MVGKSHWYHLNLEEYQSASGKGNNSIQGNPEFVDYYHIFLLTENSPAVDTGINIGVQTDIEGSPRSQGNDFDIGVFESPYSREDIPPDESYLLPPTLNITN